MLTEPSLKKLIQVETERHNDILDPVARRDHTAFLAGLEFVYFGPGSKNFEGDND